MNAPNPEEPPVMLAKKLHECPIDPTGYWMSEKLDGVRGFWDGTHLVSKKGNVFAAPKWFTDCLPKTPLDGELWGGRGTFNQTSGTVRRHKPHEGWRYLVYKVFDLPTHKGPWEERQEALRKVVAEANCPYLSQIPNVQVRDRAHIDEALSRVIALAGEGVMLVKPGSAYEPQRTSCLLKVKKYFDAEGTVIEHVPGKGKHKGRLGALGVRSEDGHTFKVGTGFSDLEREQAAKLFPIGTLVTYRYFDKTPKGIPREPRFERVRAEEPARASNLQHLSRSLMR